MQLGMKHAVADGYSSSLQIARVLSEKWLSNYGYCPCCCGKLLSYPNNNPAADFHCPRCRLEFELKSKNGIFGRKIVDGAYSTMLQKIRADKTPSFFLLNYTRPDYLVTDLQVVPSHFLHDGVIEAKRPLSDTARRAGWQGCNILLDKLPRHARINVIRGGQVAPRSCVKSEWLSSTFLREVSVSERGWLAETMRCIEALGRNSFSLADIYKFESELSKRYPNNRNIRPKLRQQLQKLRDSGYVRFLGNGLYAISGRSFSEQSA